MESYQRELVFLRIGVLFPIVIIVSSYISLILLTAVFPAIIGYYVLFSSGYNLAPGYNLEKSIVAGIIGNTILYIVHIGFVLLWFEFNGYLLDQAEILEIIFNFIEFIPYFVILSIASFPIGFACLGMLPTTTSEYANSAIAIGTTGTSILTSFVWLTLVIGRIIFINYKIYTIKSNLTPVKSNNNSKNTISQV